MCANQQAALYGFGFMGIGKRELQERAQQTAQALIARHTSEVKSHSLKDRSRDSRSTNSSAIAMQSRDVDEDMVLCLECCTGSECNDELCGSRMLLSTFLFFSFVINYSEQCLQFRKCKRLNVMKKAGLKQTFY